MASIIVDLSDDIKKLQSLKAEIQEVKKELASINVNVHLDIKRDMEAKLKSLTSQYDALVKKVSEAEGKVIASTQRINQAAEKIINAQEQLAKVTGAQPQTGNASSGANAAAANAETASVQAQAKAYDELTDEIDAVMGTRTQNIRRMIEEQNAIRIINKELKRMQKLNQSGMYSKSEIRRMEQLNASLLQHKTALSELRQSLNNSFKLDNAAATSMNALSQSLARMRMTYRELTEEERNSPFGKELLSSIQQADAKIKQLDATIGNHQRNMGNYASGWNGLNTSIQQVGRELPSLAMGWNTFFLAISNNLPILSDELARARKEYNALKAAGQQATPVWKQVVSSLLSWQTALTVGITLLTLYGKEMVEWIGGLFKAKSSVESLDKQMRNLNDEMKSNDAGYGKNIVALKSLAEEWRKLGDIAQKTRWIEDNQSEFNKLGISISNVRDAEKAFVDHTDAIIESFKLRAKAAAASSLAEEKYRDALIKQNEAELERNKGITRGDRIMSGMSVIQGPGVSGYQLTGEKIDSEKFYEERVKAIETEQKELEEAGDAYFELYKKNKKEAEDIVKNIGIDIKGNNDNTTEESVSNLKSYLDEYNRLLKENEDRQVELIQDGTERQIAEIKLRYDREIAEVEKLEEELKKTQGGNLTEEQQNTFNTAYSTIEKKREKEINVVNNEEQENERKKIKSQEAEWNEYLLKFGDYQQKRKAIVEKYNQQIAEAQTAGDAAMLYKEQQNALDELDNSIKGSTTLMGQLFADASEMSVNEIQKIIDKAELLIEYLGAQKDGQGNANINGENVSRQQILDLGISENSLQNLETSTDEVDALRRAIEKLKGELGSKSPFKSFEKGIKDAVNAIKSGDLAKGLEGIGNSIAEFAPAMSQFGKDIGTIFGSGDLGNKIAGISSAIGGLGQTAVGIGQAMSGDVIGGVMGAVGGIASIVSAFEGLFGADYSEFEAMKYRYEELSKVWDELISKKQEYIDISYGAEASKAYDEAVDILKQQQEYARQLAETRKNSGASAGSHSIAYRQNEWLRGYASELYQYVSQNGNYDDITNALLGATADQLREVKENMGAFWAGLDDEFQAALDQIIEADDKIDELGESLKSAFTGIDFDSFQDGFVNMLSDLESDNQDFADDLEKKLQNAIFSSLVANEYKERIKKLYEQWSDYAQSDGELTSGEAEKIREEYNQIVSDMLADRDALMEAMGWSAEQNEQQSDSRGGFETMTQDQATELSGRFTAVAESNYRIEGAITELSGSISAMTANVTGMYNIADETRSILANSYLELQEINENTGNSAKYLKDIKADIAIVKQNTSRL